MTNRELLELAAKAAGYSVEKPDDPDGVFVTREGDRYGRVWNPLTDDGDALRLAVKLHMLVDCQCNCARPLPDSLGWEFGVSPDEMVATRLAIVRAAAEIGRAMP